MPVQRTVSLVVPTRHYNRSQPQGLSCCSRNNRQVLPALNYSPTLLRRFVGLLAHRHVSQEERRQDGSCTDDQDRNEKNMRGCTQSNFQWRLPDTLVLLS